MHVDPVGYGIRSTKKDRAVSIGNPVTTVGSRHQAGIQRDHIKQTADPELLLQKEGYDPQLGKGDRRIDEQLARVVSGFAVDVDGAGEVGGFRLRCFIVKFLGMFLMFSGEIRSAARD